MSTYAIELIDSDSITWFRKDWHKNRIPEAPSGHTLGQVSVKTDQDVAVHTAALTRYLGSADTALGQVFLFLMDNTAGALRIQPLLRSRVPGNVTQARLLDYTILAIDELTPGSVAGTVSSGTEAGVTGAIVTISKGAFSKSATSGALGVYVIEGIPVDTGYAIVASKTGYVSAGATVAITEGAETDQDLTLSEFGALAGTVTDETGNVSGGTVNIVAVDTTTPVLYTGTTIADGTYSILNVAPGTYDVWFSRDNHVSAKTDDVTITAATVETQDKVLGEFANYSGIIDDGADPIVGAVVDFYLSYPGTPDYTATSAALGAWSIPNIEPGTYQVRVSKATYVTQFVMDRAVVADADVTTDNFTLSLA